ncbi:hypothetical protein [Reinekea forsetii]|jgi:hypothetical protein|uniref:Curli production assembly/transport component CsgG n=1 Tax=Reinekea forsetii TaxID=1336806 RepID=A0A2K8KK36_9GAMM|nr:hypothetical protein [Reinekea forsetii]ATX75370.1 hypothetical protein REIFOR_00193 [Reinekea forsetii]MDO7645682.1 hypothetical protein [Reinekea forsetii]
MTFKWLGLVSLFLSGTLMAAGNVLLVTDLSDDNLASRPDLRLIASSAINRLQDYQVSNAKTSVRPDSEAAIEAMLEAASRAKLENLAVVSLYTPKRNRATVTMSLYNVGTGDLTIQRALEFRYKELTALLAQLEYELPLMLKREFRELGSVVKVNSDQIYFDLGKNANVEVGQIFRVFRRGTEIKSGSGESFGFVDDQTGIIEIIEVSAIYSIAKIHLGRPSIRNDDWVELADQSIQTRGQVLSKLDNKVALNIGRKSGVVPGAYFAVYKDIKVIDANESFREVVGRIRITEAQSNSARGEIARSDHYNLAKALVNENDYIEEISYLHRNQLVLAQTNYGVLGETVSLWNAGINVESGLSTDLAFRLRGAYGANWYLGLGANSALNNSESFRYGMDLMYGADGFGSYIYTDANIPTVLAKHVIFAIEAGYLLNANATASGLSVGLSMKIGLDSLF